MSSPSPSPPASSPPPNVARKRARQTSSEEHASALSAMLPSPPSTVASESPRTKASKRRRQAASDETSSSEGVSIIQEEFRAGAPFLCVLPAETSALPDADFFNNQAHQANVVREVRDILQRHSVAMRSITGPFRRRGAYGRQNDRPDRAVVVEARKGDDNTWYTAIEAILERFNALGFEDLNIEIVDDRANHFHISPIDRNNPFIATWPSITPHLMQVLNDTDCNIPWLTIDCVRLGYQRPEEEAPNPITVLVTIDEHAIALNNAWLKNELEKSLIAAGASYVAVRIFRGGFFRCAGEQKNYKVKAEVGSSISLAGNTTTGTLGGYVAVAERRTGQIKVMGLTCHHVLRPENHPSIADIDANGVRLGQSVSLARIPVMQPAESGHEKEMDQLRAERRRHRANLSGSRSLPARLSEAERKRTLDSIRVLERAASEEIKARNDFIGTHGKLGALWCSSGERKRTRGDARLDWALIDLADNRKGAKNEIPPKSELTGTAARVFNPLYKYVTDIENLKDCDELIKVGAATQGTSGFLNAIKSITLDTDPARQLLPSNDWLVVPSPEELRRAHLFSQPGDSGAWVIENFGGLTAMLWGGNLNTGVGYVTDIQDVFHDINEALAPDWSMASLDKV